MAHALGSEFRSRQAVVQPIMSVVKPKICCYGNASALFEAAARLIAERIVQQVEKRGTCRLALAGSTTPRPVYQRLAVTSTDRRNILIFY